MDLPSSSGIKPKEAESLKNQYFATFGKVHEYLESLGLRPHAKKDIPKPFSEGAGIFPVSNRRTVP